MGEMLSRRRYFYVLMGSLLLFYLLFLGSLHNGGDWGGSERAAASSGGGEKEDGQPENLGPFQGGAPFSVSSSTSDLIHHHNKELNLFGGKHMVWKPQKISANPDVKKPSLCSDKAYRESALRFKVGDRKDFQGSIRDALDELGMCKVRTKKTKYDFYWDKTFDDRRGKDEEKSLYNSDLIKDGAIVSSIPGIRENLGLKPSLARIHTACIKRNRDDDLCSFTKRAFNFDRHVGKFSTFVLTFRDERI